MGTIFKQALQDKDLGVDVTSDLTIQHADSRVILRGSIQFQEFLNCINMSERETELKINVVKMTFMILTFFSYR